MADDATTFRRIPQEIFEGKLVEHWGVVDRMGMLQQLGFMPTPPGS